MMNAKYLFIASIFGTIGVADTAYSKITLKNRTGIDIMVEATTVTSDCSLRQIMGNKTITTQYKCPVNLKGELFKQAPPFNYDLPARAFYMDELGAFEQQVFIKKDAEQTYNVNFDISIATRKARGAPGKTQVGNRIGWDGILTNGTTYEITMMPRIPNVRADIFVFTKK